MALSKQQLTAKGVAPLIAGDFVVFLVFAAIGRASHGEASGIAALEQVAETAAPFAIGWFIVAPLLGAYRPEVVANPRTMLSRSALAWLLAWPIGLGLRALLRQSGIPLSFAVVTGITVLVLLLAWRGLYSWLIAKAKF